MNRKPGNLPGSAPVGRGIALLLVALLLTLVLTGATSRLDNLLYDMTARLSPRSTPENILIVAIDDESLAELGAWPWPRARHQALIEKLNAGQPRAIIYDVLFLSGSDAAADAALGRAMAASGKIVLPMLFQVPGKNGRAYQEEPPIPPLAQAARIGHADIHPDKDGVVRRIDLALDGDQRWLHAVAQATAADPKVAQLVAALPRFVPRPAAVPLQRKGTVLIDFAGGGGQIRTISFARVLRGELPAAFVRDSYVLVGVTAAGQGDRFSTPTSDISGLLPGVEIQAYLLGTLQRGRGIEEAGAFARIALGILGVFAVVTAFMRLPPSSAALAGVIIVLAILLLSGLLLAAFKIWLPPMAAIVVQIIAQPLWAWRRLDAVSRYMVEELQQLNIDGQIVQSARPLPASSDRVELQIALLRQAVGQTRNLRELAATAIQSLPDPTVMVAGDGGIAMSNHAAQALFGQGGAVTADAITRRFLDGSATLPAISPETLADPQGPWRGDKTDGAGNIFEIRAAQWRDDGGRAMGWVVRFFDVTRLRRAERQREEALQLLTHDMRSPQSAILALIASHSSEVSSALADRLRHYAARTIALADGFLQLAKAESREYELATVDLSDVLIEAVDDLWPLSSARRINVVTSGTETANLVSGSSGLLMRSFVNLIGNAIKFSHEGGSINCTLGREIDAQGAACISFEIRDQGIGMPPEWVDNLFQRFRFQNANPQNPDGVGLGLAFVHAVITNHGGTIRCSSQPGIGTSMMVRLPALNDSVPLP